MRDGLGDERPAMESPQKAGPSVTDERQRGWRSPVIHTVRIAVTSVGVTMQLPVDIKVVSLMFGFGRSTLVTHPRKKGACQDAAVRPDGAEPPTKASIPETGTGGACPMALGVLGGRRVVRSWSDKGKDPR